jgi:hypothetical protein
MAAIKPRHLQIQKEQIGSVLLRRLKYLCPIGAFPDETGAGQGGPRQRDASASALVRWQNSWNGL